jgi:hypothetical protein
LKTVHVFPSGRDEVWDFSFSFKGLSENAGLGNGNFLATSWPQIGNILASVGQQIGRGMATNGR